MLLNTVNLANELAVHSLNELAVYQNGTVSLYAKNSVSNDLDLLKDFVVADVKRLAISDNGKNLCAQTSTQVLRLSQEGAAPLEVTGVMAISDSNYFLVLLPTAVQIVRETTVNLSAILSTRDKVVCGVNSFVVYDTARALVGTYTGVTLTNNPQAKPLLHVAHVGRDKFAYFYNDGTVTYSGASRANTVLRHQRNCGKHVIADDGSFEWAYMLNAPLSQAVKLRAYTPPPVGAAAFSLFDDDGVISPLITNNGGATIANSLVTLSGTQFLSLPGTESMVPRLSDFSVECEVLFTSMPNAVSGTSLQPMFYWGNWATDGQPMNMDIYYINTAPPRTGFSVSHELAAQQWMSYEQQMNINQWYNYRWERKNGVLKFYVDNIEVSSMDFAFDITYDSTEPVTIGRRRGGTTGNVYWYSRMQMRKFAIKIG